MIGRRRRRRSVRRTGSGSRGPDGSVTGSRGSSTEFASVTRGCAAGGRRGGHRRPSPPAFDSWGVDTAFDRLRHDPDQCCLRRSLPSFVYSTKKVGAPIAGQPGGAQPLDIRNPLPLTGSIAAIRSEGRCFCPCDSPGSQRTERRQLAPAPIARNFLDGPRAPFLGSVSRTAPIRAHTPGVAGSRNDPKKSLRQTGPDTRIEAVPWGLPQRSHGSTWPPRAAVRHDAIAAITRRCAIDSYGPAARGRAHLRRGDRQIPGRRRETPMTERN